MICCSLFVCRREASLSSESLFTSDHRSHWIICRTISAQQASVLARTRSSSAVRVLSPAGSRRGATARAHMLTQYLGKLIVLIGSTVATEWVLAVRPKLSGCFEHGYDIFRRDIVLDIMNCSHNIAAIFPQTLDLPLHFLAHLLNRTVR